MNKNSIANTTTSASAGNINKSWVCEAIRKINADYNRSSDTHLIRVELPCFDDITLYLKDESTHPSGSLKHRLARSLFLYGLCNGYIHEDTTIVESSSGSTAISEAYFARLLNLRFIAVVPETTAKEKLDKIRFYGGECHKVPGKDIYTEATRLAGELNGHYMDQFTYAERATDWRGNNNIAESIFHQMGKESHPIPDWVVMSAGTGGTSATIGRYIRLNPEFYHRTRLCVVDPENSVFYPYFQNRNPNLTSEHGSRIEGIGRPRVEPSFQPDVIDRMLSIPDAASIATIRWLEGILGRKCGGSTGTNVYGALQLMQEMQHTGTSGSVVSLICDSGERYLDSYYDDKWVSKQGLDLDPYLQQLRTICS
ncbi:PLP-dependent cysteine synthase family protein [Hahella sp. CCB-MM4]|uniref:PLP-dependent cysteine synthase family protein n=1 Tax=Hahella sp. (strain CCB-MM4) TaxID=1926491 RepID=UPI000B9ABD60|nr:PLP-dependent cysteine synthase family protein [Hahella sp. CCB-MM4]